MEEPFIGPGGKNMKIGYIGLGKMGLNMVERMAERGYSVSVFDVAEEARKKASSLGAETARSLKELLALLEPPRLLWLMVPHSVVDDVLSELIPILANGDTIIDGGNSYFKDTIRRGKEITSKGIGFLDAGVSGGPSGARNGACIMVGGKKEDYEKFEALFRDLSVDHGYAYVGGYGAGHFVKMVHNGIEYGMMQALAEGFHILKQSDFDLPLVKIADLYNHGSVIESRLAGWLKDGYEAYGENLDEISGTVGHTGEGEWTAKTADELGVPAPIIKGAFQFRIDSEKSPSYAGKVLSTLRNMFGGHKAR